MTRRTVFQLTPLLDLLLIVIFAQYLNLKHATNEEVSRVEQKARETLHDEGRLRREAETDRDQAQRLEKDTRNELHAKGRTIRELQQENDELRQTLVAARFKAEEVARQAKLDLLRIGELVRETLRLEEGDFEQAIRDLSAEEKKGLRRSLEEMRGKTPSAIVRHFREMAEIRKRCDVWEVHVEDNDAVRLVRNEETVREGVFVDSADQVALLVKSAVQASDEPKSLVLFLYTYGNAKAVTREKHVRPGLEKAREILKELYNRNKTFVISNLGYDDRRP